MTTLKGKINYSGFSFLFYFLTIFPPKISKRPTLPYITLLLGPRCYRIVVWYKIEPHAGFLFLFLFLFFFTGFISFFHTCRFVENRREKLEGGGENKIFLLLLFSIVDLSPLLRKKQGGGITTGLAM